MSGNDAVGPAVRSDIGHAFHPGSGFFSNATTSMAMFQPGVSSVVDALEGDIGIVSHLTPHSARCTLERVPMTGDEWLVLGVRAAGGLHFVTLVLACFTPIPPDWEANLERLPTVHRRFAVAQNAFIGATIAFCGLLCLWLAQELVAGTTPARWISGGIALWWAGRLVVLPWLGVWPHITNAWLRVGFVLLLAQCAIYAAAFGWLALRAGGS
jgi:hypothetical protein